MSNTPTPRTDEFGAEPIPVDERYQPKYGAALEAWVQFARTLEAELTATNARIAELERDIQHQRTLSSHPMNLTEMIALALELDGKAKIKDPNGFDRLLSEYRTLCPELAKACAELEKEVKKCGDAINIHIDIEQRLEREKAALVKALEAANTALLSASEAKIFCSESMDIDSNATEDVKAALTEINKLTNP